MADDVDLAGDRIEIEMGRLLAAFQPATGESLTECEACGNDIPEARQKAVDGCRTCFECANAEYLRKNGVRRG